MFDLNFVTSLTQRKGYVDLPAVFQPASHSHINTHSHKTFLQTSVCFLVFFVSLSYPQSPFLSRQSGKNKRKNRRMFLFSLCSLCLKVRLWPKYLRSKRTLLDVGLHAHILNSAVSWNIMKQQENIYKKIMGWIVFTPAADGTIFHPRFLFSGLHASSKPAFCPTYLQPLACMGTILNHFSQEHNKGEWWGTNYVSHPCFPTYHGFRPETLRLQTHN